MRLDADRAIPLLLGATLLLTVAAMPTALLATGRTLPFDVPGLATWVRLTDPLRPGGLGSWLLAAMCLLAAFLAVSLGGDLDLRGIGRPRSWRAFAVVATVLSVDHVTGVHDWALVGPLRGALGGPLGDLTWALIALPLLVVAALACRGLTMGLPRSAAVGVLLGVGLYVGAAVLLDVVCTVLRATAGPASLMLAVGTVTEQAMEMVGLTALLVAVARFADVVPSWGDESAWAVEQAPTSIAAAVGPVAQPAFTAPAVELDLTASWGASSPTAWAIPAGAAQAEVIASGAASAPTQPPVAHQPAPGPGYPQFGRYPSATPSPSSSSMMREPPPRAGRRARRDERSQS